MQGEMGANVESFGKNLKSRDSLLLLWKSLIRYH